MLKTILSLLFLASCGDDYVTYENRIIDAQNKVPVYFYCDAKPNYDFANTWYPEFTYYVYQLEEGEYDAYFHAYCVQDDSIIWSGVQPITIEGRKKIWGEYVSSANFTPDNIANVTPMAYVSVKY